MRELRRRAAQLTQTWDDGVAEAQRARELGLESYARKKVLELSDLLQQGLSGARARGAAALVELHRHAQEKRAALSRSNVEDALAGLEQRVARKTTAAEHQAYAEFEQFAQTASRKYAELTSEEVRLACREQTQARAQQVVQELAALADEKVAALQTAAEEHRNTLTRHAETQLTLDVLRGRAASIGKAFEAACESAQHEAHRVEDDLRALVRDIEDEQQHPAPQTEFGALLEQEAARLELKVRRGAEHVAAELRDPGNQLQVERFVQGTVARLRELTQQLARDARTGADEALSGAVRKQLSRVREEASKPAQQTADSAPRLAKRPIRELDEDPLDHQSDYVEQLTPGRRGIEDGQRH